ncbi:MAG TPA: glyoxylate/hydroxypyruvate reductase A [Stellaceae bacterium]|jgi:glyoxylate/hydroxypyruvate reductase A|nr:glyoxylate/hydroxypyruvate reductase A [Stellaceae bacterium]
MPGALLFSSRLDDPVAWSAALKAAMPELDVRVSPDLGDPADIETALVWKAPPGELASLPNLKLITNLGAGVDPILADETIPKHIPVARLGDEVMAQMMAQFVTMCVLRHYRDLGRYGRQQRDSRWDYELPRASYDVRVGVMGIGLLGGAAARMLQSIGFPVAGWGRSPRMVEGIETFHGADGLTPFLARTEILVCLLPLTRETRHIVNRDALYRLPRGAKLVNCGRGGTVDEDALLAALRDGQIAEATLDVFETEPLPAEHPFWQMDNVLVLPHIASIAVPEIAARDVVENIRRLESGQPFLNIVDRARGY